MSKSVDDTKREQFLTKLAIKKLNEDLNGLSKFIDAVIMPHSPLKETVLFQELREALHKEIAKNEAALKSNRNMHDIYNKLKAFHTAIFKQLDQTLIMKMEKSPVTPNVIFFRIALKTDKQTIKLHQMDNPSMNFLENLNHFNELTPTEQLNAYPVPQIPLPPKAGLGVKIGTLSAGTLGTIGIGVGIGLLVLTGPIGWTVLAAGSIFAGVSAIFAHLWSEPVLQQRQERENVRQILEENTEQSYEDLQAKSQSSFLLDVAQTLRSVTEHYEEKEEKSEKTEMEVSRSEVSESDASNSDELSSTVSLESEEDADLSWLHSPEDAPPQTPSRKKQR